MKGPAPWLDCGTPAAARRHYRRGDKPLIDYCQTCAQAARLHWAERQGTAAGNLSPDRREIRNGLPFVPYVYRGTGEDQMEAAS